MACAWITYFKTSLLDEPSFPIVPVHHVAASTGREKAIVWTCTSICHVFGIEEPRWKISLLLPPPCAFPSSTQCWKLSALREGNKGARNSIKKRSKAKWNIVSLSVLLSFSPIRQSVNHFSAAPGSSLIARICLPKTGVSEAPAMFRVVSSWTSEAKLDIKMSANGEKRLRLPTALEFF